MGNPAGTDGLDALPASRVGRVTHFDASELEAFLRAKYPDREHQSPDSVESLLEEIAGGGWVKTLAALDAILEATREAVARWKTDRSKQG
jgi:hypothetical protein